MGQRFELTDAVVFNVQAPMIGEPDGVGWEDLIGVTGDEESERPPGLGLSELAAANGGLSHLNFVADNDPGRFLQTVPGGKPFFIPGSDLEMAGANGLGPISIGATLPASATTPSIQRP